MTIREYFYTDTMTEEEFLLRMEEAVELYELYEDDAIDLEQWCEEHGVDFYAVDARTGETEITLWVWDMCGE